MPALLLLVCLAFQGGRLRPPAGLECSRDQLTSFTGRVTSYSRSDSRMTLGLRTDEDTDEKFTLSYAKEQGPAKVSLFEGSPLRPEHWPRIEKAKGTLHSGMRATVWVCEGGAQPVVDWRPPPDR